MGDPLPGTPGTEPPRGAPERADPATSTDPADAASLPDVAQIRRLIERHFSVYDAQREEHVAGFYVNIDPDTVEEKFEALRREMKPEGLVPVLKYQGGEHAIFVLKKPQRNFRSRRVNLVLFILTWITTTLAGAVSFFYYGNPDTTTITQGEYFRQLVSPLNLAGGFLTFALPLMLILGVHEMGHYWMSKRHGMEASLPFFIPIPPFITGVPIGTLGAFISMREPIPSRKALLDIGAAGPIAGILVAIPVLIVGMLLMAGNPVTLDPSSMTEGGLLIGTPLLYDLLAAPFGFGENQVIHPMAFAGWVGLFVTAINLLPAGQLDGGHIAAALLGERARYLSYAAIAALILLGIGSTELGLVGYSGWLVFALLIAFLGLNHPPTLDGVSGLDQRRVIVGVATFAIMVVCFTPVPISVV